mmetsp:Transcript_11500/g.9934  ORF Transcript_11500/g.9934 Transcript_11500/m.9934 type:complete len:242 (-) Transcript_11500:527-1252(-)
MNEDQPPAYYNNNNNNNNRAYQQQAKPANQQHVALDFSGGFNRNTGLGSEDDLRKGFIKKVYGILLAQLCFTVFVAGMLIAGGVDETWWDEDELTLTTTGRALYIISIVLIIVLTFALICFPNVARKVPVNYICLFLYTLAMTFIVTLACSQYDRWSVLQAAVLTILITAALTAYACTTKTEITYKGFCTFLLCWFCVCFPLAIVISVVFDKTTIGATIITVLLVILYSFYIIFDTKLIVG